MGVCDLYALNPSTPIDLQWSSKFKTSLVFMTVQANQGQGGCGGSGSGVADMALGNRHNGENKSWPSS